MQKEVKMTPVLRYWVELMQMPDNILRREYKKVTGQSYWHRNMGSIRHSIVFRKWGDSGLEEVYAHPSGLSARELYNYLKPLL